MCGGAGCGSCGGFSCDDGALTKAENALIYTKDAEKLLLEKETKIEELYRGVNRNSKFSVNLRSIKSLKRIYDHCRLLKPELKRSML